MDNAAAVLFAGPFTASLHPARAILRIAGSK